MIPTKSMEILYIKSKRRDPVRNFKDFLDLIKVKTPRLVWVPRKFFKSHMSLVQVLPKRHEYIDIRCFTANFAFGISSSTHVFVSDCLIAVLTLTKTLSVKTSQESIIIFFITLIRKKRDKVMTGHTETGTCETAERRKEWITEKNRRRERAEKEKKFPIQAGEILPDDGE